MHLHAYVFLFALAILLSLFGLIVVSIPCAAMALTLALRSELSAIFAVFWPPRPVKKTAPDSL